MKSNSSTVYRLETNQPLAGRTEQHTLKEWKRVYGYDRDTIVYLGGRFVEAHLATLPENVIPAIALAKAGAAFGPVS